MALRKNLVTPSVKEGGLWDDARGLQKDDGAADHGRKGGGGADKDDSIYLRLVLVIERAKYEWQTLTENEACRQTQSTHGHFED